VPHHRCDQQPIARLRKKTKVCKAFFNDVHSVGIVAFTLADVGSAQCLGWIALNSLFCPCGHCSNLAGDPLAIQIIWDPSAEASL